jgi:undecaprenyl phosphate N,N'-diacetylbacillosamine 1-phosphate transferase
LYPKLIKPFFDRVFALAGLLLLSPIFVLIVVALAIFQGGVFFVQERIGYRQRPFRMIKFRTLRKDSKEQTSVGGFLRTTSLDELPQLWNVLVGDMSMVGPRPLPADYLPLYSEYQRSRHMVRPGITGWTQVNGRHSIPWSEKLELDVYYVQNISFMLDLLIIAKTAVLLLSFRKDISLSEKPFAGN